MEVLQGRYPFGKGSASVRNYDSIPTVFLQYSYSIPKVSLKYSYSIPIVSLKYSYSVLPTIRAREEVTGTDGGGGGKECLSDEMP